MIVRGIEKLVHSNIIDPGRFALLAHAASVDESFRYSRNVLGERFPDRLKRIFSPQHGLMGAEQANMVESPDGETGSGIKVVSLYSGKRKPDVQDLEDIETIIVDIQDVGARYYTYIYTMAYIMKTASDCGKRVIVADRPNPLGGTSVYGNINKLRSFVGMYPLAVQYGLTIGELAKFFNEEFEIGCDLTVVRMSGWERELTIFEDRERWVPTSPNMPHPETVQVYPGGCLLEGTNLSEGRGTTMPFKILGAPFVKTHILENWLKTEGLQGARFRPLSFRPMFDKFAGELCHGLFVHVIDQKNFNPYLTYIAIIKGVCHLWRREFEWKLPPYEYEYDELPIDILTGDRTSVLAT